MLNMYGVYKIFKDGKLVAEEKNKLTLLGRSNALNAMLGLTQSFASTLGIGIDSTANGSGTFHNKTDLGFSVGKYPVLSSSLGTDGSRDLLVYTSRINDTSRYTIRELGLFSNQLSASSDLNSLTLLNFESGDPIKEIVGGTAYYLSDSNSYVENATFEKDNTNSRIGSYSVKVPLSSTIFMDEMNLDLSSFYASDSLVFAYYASAAMTVTLKFYSGSSNQNYTFTANAQGYFVQTLEKGTTTIDWSNITKIEIVTSSGGFAILDGLKISKFKATDSIDGLLSRVVLSSPINKEAGSVIDIEYNLIFDLSAG
jgi:hypothetical protein